jgi:hypothetical protein
MAKALTFTVEMGKPFSTGEECPVCLFDSVEVVLLWINRRPDFMWLCVRCKTRLREVES